MAFSADVQLERTAHLADDRMFFELTLTLLAREQLDLCATIETEAGRNPVVTAAANTIGIHPADEDALVLAAYKEMRRYFNSTPWGGDTWWVRWAEPDLEPWIHKTLKEAVAIRVISIFGCHVHPTAPPIVQHRYVESAEG
jgi:hypothetical protein